MGSGLEEGRQREGEREGGEGKEGRGRRGGEGGEGKEGRERERGMEEGHFRLHCYMQSA